MLKSRRSCGNRRHKTQIAFIAEGSDVETSVYIDRVLFVQIAEGLGLTGICHTNYEDTKIKLEQLGLSVD